MKSIYEASVAYGKKHQGTVNIEDFEAGANYVLDVVEDFMRHNLVHSGNLKRLIEQLKK
jgi:hypothetical protein